MERYLEWNIAESAKVGDFLRIQAGFTKKQISQAKFRKDGIQKNGTQCRVTESLFPGDVLRVYLERADRKPEDHLCEKNPQKREALLLPEKALQEGSGSAAEVDPGKLRIVYEDEDILVVDKPAGLVTHPVGVHKSDTMSGLVDGYFRNKNEGTLIRSIGRLDKETSGLLLFARNQIAAARLQKQREEGILQKTYLAAASGTFPEEKSCGTICIPIGKDPENTLGMAVSADGSLSGCKKAVTHFRVLKEMGDNSLLEVWLETGRTHQIRVHMASVGHPLLGDTLYNDSHSSDAFADDSGSFAEHYGILAKGSRRSVEDTGIFKRAALHAWRLCFLQPFTGRKMILEAPLPDDFITFQNQKF